jgi:hypothetical protein
MGPMSNNYRDVNNPLLRDAARSYVRAALELAQREQEGLLEKTASTGTEWVRQSSNTFITRESQVPYWFICLALCRDELMALPEYRRLVAVLLSDATIAAMLGTVVGSAWSGVGVNAETIVSYLLQRFVEKRGSLRFDEALFEQVLRGLDADLHRSEFDYFLITPLFGLTAESLPIRLAPTIEIDHLTDSEIVRCLNVGAMAYPIFPGIALIGSGIGVRIRFRAQKRIGETPNKVELDRATQMVEHLRQQVEDVIHGLRLFKEGSIPHPVTVMFSEQWPGHGGTQILGALGATRSLCNYELKTERLSNFNFFGMIYKNVLKSPLRLLLEGLGTPTSVTDPRTSSSIS